MTEVDLAVKTELLSKVKELSGYWTRVIVSCRFGDPVCPN